MVRKVIAYITYPVLIAGIVLGLVGVAYAATNIDSTNKWQTCQVFGNLTGLLGVRTALPKTWHRPAAVAL